MSNVREAEALFARPPSVRGPESCEVPLEAGDHGRLYVEVFIEERSYWFIVDTGAVPTIISKQLAAAHAIDSKPMPKGVLYGGGGGVRSSVGQIPAMAIGSATIEDCPIFVTDMQGWNMSEETLAGFPVHGFLGSQLMQFLEASIEYDPPRLVLRGPREATADTVSD